MNAFNTFTCLLKLNETLKINEPTIVSVSYPTSTSATIYFTASTTSGITDYQYSIDNITYTSIGILTNYFTISGITNSVTLYFIALRNTLESSPTTFSLNPTYTSKATIGGTGSGKFLITSNYEYYVFTNTSASSTLTFTTATNIEYLVVGAGGNGGPCDFGGGGGAGGVLKSTVSVSSGTTFTITVGNYATYNNRQATRGGNSTISGTGITNGTAYGGGSGAAAWQYTFAANTGGSGGGGGAYGYDIGGVATTGSGYNGTSGGNAGSGFGSGGGGGAGGNGYNSIYINPVGWGGVGGNGTSVYSDWIVTVAGYMNTVFTNWSNYTVSNGIGYIASGGAGGTGSNSAANTGFTARTIGGGGSGGPRAYANINDTPLPTAGIPNTGGGGGGFGGGFPGYYQYFQNVGGSGIIIIRIPII
jgi:hypothetical protein